MGENRGPGYYWIKYGGRWWVALWEPDADARLVGSWALPGYEDNRTREMVEEVDERRIVRAE